MTMKFPVITLTCPTCHTSTFTVLFGIESAIYYVCECGEVVPFVIVKESESK